MAKKKQIFTSDYDSKVQQAYKKRRLRELAGKKPKTKLTRFSKILLTLILIMIAIFSLFAIILFVNLWNQNEYPDDASKILEIDPDRYDLISDYETSLNISNTISFDVSFSFIYDNTGYVFYAYASQDENVLIERLNVKSLYNEDNSPRVFFMNITEGPAYGLHFLFKQNGYWMYNFGGLIIEDPILFMDELSRISSINP